LPFFSRPTHAPFFDAGSGDFVTRPTFRQRWEFLGMSLAVRITALLPYVLLRFLAFALGALVCACDKRGRRVAWANLEAAFGPRFTEAEQRRLTRRSYQVFARTILELFWSSNVTRENLSRFARVEGLGAAFHHDPNQPVIYLCLHASNFEWLSLALAHTVRPGIVVAQNLKNPLLGGLFDRLRSGCGHTLIPQERAVIRMFRHLKKGGSFSMLVDLSLDPGESSVVIEQFDGLKTCVTQMHAALALRTEAKIVPAECRIDADGRYRMIFHEPMEYTADATSAEIAQQCWDLLEPALQAQPELWLWSYKHWRFRPSSGESGRYPFYANPAKRFDTLIRSTELAVAAV